MTRIVTPPRSPKRRRIYVDDEPAVTCHVNVVARLRLRVGMEAGADLLEQIAHHQRRQACFDAAVKLLNRREHSRAQLRQKLLRHHEPPAVQQTLDELARMGNLDDDRLARAQAERLRRRGFGRDRAQAELRRLGFEDELAAQAAAEAYRDEDPLAAARAEAQRQMARLGGLDPLTARRRLAGRLGRRGFDGETIEQVIASLDDSEGVE